MRKTVRSVTLNLWAASFVVSLSSKIIWALWSSMSWLCFGIGISGLRSYLQTGRVHVRQDGESSQPVSGGDGNQPSSAAGWPVLTGDRGLPRPGCGPGLKIWSLKSGLRFEGLVAGLVSLGLWRFLRGLWSPAFFGGVAGVTGLLVPFCTSGGRSGHLGGCFWSWCSMGAWSLPSF